MSIETATCFVCHKLTLAVWAKNPPEEKRLYCPVCFMTIRSKQGTINFPFSLYLGMPQIHKGAWQDHPAINFTAIAQFIESCVRKESAKGAEPLTQDVNTLEEFLFRLHDFVPDPTAIPYWRYKIEYALKVIEDKTTSKLSSDLDLRNKIDFWQTRIEQAMIPGVDSISIKQLQIIQHLKSCVAAWERGEPLPKMSSEIIEVNWELLDPDGNGLWERISNYHKNLENVHGANLDQTRLKLLHDRNPDVVYVGRSKFDGYVVFVFSRADVAFLESAYFGNALYIMKASDWRELSKLSKTDLIINPRHNVTRVIHSSQWRSRLQRLLLKHGVT